MFAPRSSGPGVTPRDRLRPSQKTLLNLAQLLFVVLAGIVSADIVRETIADLSRPLPELHLEEPPPAPVPPPKPSLAHYAVITERDIFNPPRPVEPPPPVVLAPLDRRLIGIGHAGSRPFAILEAPDGVQEIQHVGAVVAGRTLAAVGRDEIVLRAGTHEEVLRLPIPVSELAARLAGEGANEGTRDGFILAAFASHSPHATDGSAATAARVEPVFREKKLLGLRVSALRKKSFLEGLGLRSGDVIQKIGERAVSDPLGAIRRFRDLREGEEVALEVARGDQTLLLPRDAERPDEPDVTLAALLVQLAKERRPYHAAHDDEHARKLVRRQLRKRWVPPSMREIEVRVSDAGVES